MEIANILKVNPKIIKEYNFQNQEDIIYILLWLEEQYPRMSLDFNILERVDDDGNDTVMNVPQLVEDYEEGTDGYCLLVERRPSLTPLSVSFGGKISNLEDWEF